MKKYSECSFWVVWGMSVQAFTTAGLTATNDIDPNPGQQFGAGCLYVLLCLFLALWSKRESARPHAQDGPG